MFDFIARENPEYVDALYREYRRDPRAVDERWAFVFSAYELSLAHGAGGATGPEVANLVHSYRDLGHLIADLASLGRPRRWRRQVPPRLLARRGAGRRPSTDCGQAAAGAGSLKTRRRRILLRHL